MEENNILDFAAYYLIKSFRGYGEQYRFNKLMYLLNKELKNEDIDLHLPYYWYRYGVVVKDSKKYFKLKESSFDDKEIPLKIKKKIIGTIIEIMDENRYRTTDEINAEIYKEADYDFQDDFRELNSLAEYWNKDTNSLNKSESLDINILIKRTLLHFPESDFKEIYPFYLEWENFFAKLLETDIPKRKLKILIDKFWFTFAEKLRILCNENITSKEISEWKKDYSQHLFELEEYLFNFSFEFYSKYCEYTDNSDILELDELASKIIW